MCQKLNMASKELNTVSLRTRSAISVQSLRCMCPTGSQWNINRPIYIGKTKIQKPGFFVIPFTLPEKPITFGFFGTKSACAKKSESHTGVLVSGAHARLFSTFDRTRVVRITSRAAVGWFRWRSRITWPKTRIIPCEIGAGVYIGKKPLKNPRSFKKSYSGGGFFDSGFLQCLGVVA